MVRGCIDAQDMSKGADTRWVAIKFIADTPLNTEVSARARAGNSPQPSDQGQNGWGNWTADQKTSPVALTGVLKPNWDPNGMNNMTNDGWLQVEVNLTTKDQNKTPKLKRVEITYECPNILM